ncbi:MAG: class I SAM-dependent methyltransferase [Cellulosilyticaceae bacterium]
MRVYDKLIQNSMPTTMKTSVQEHNNHTNEFFEDIIHADMHKICDLFLARLPEGIQILDVGVGPYQGGFYFKKLGYEVTAIDLSKELCKLGNQQLVQPVYPIGFDLINFKEKFEGIWACASLRHVPSIFLPGIIDNLEKALKSNGLLFTSFKCGEFEGDRNGRYFLDLNMDSAQLFFNTETLRVQSLWRSKDQSLGGEEAYWINILARKL